MCTSCVDAHSFIFVCVRCHLRMDWFGDFIWHASMRACSNPGHCPGKTVGYWDFQHEELRVRSLLPPLAHTSTISCQPVDPPSPANSFVSNHPDHASRHCHTSTSTSHSLTHPRICTLQAAWVAACSNPEIDGCFVDGATSDPPFPPSQNATG